MYARPRPHPRPRPGPGPARSAATRERLLRCGARAFARDGYEGTSLREVTSVAGANLASVQYHFGGKAAFYRECFHRLMTQHPSPLGSPEAARPRGRAAWAADLRATLHRIARDLTDPREEARWLRRLIHRELSAPGPASGAILDELFLPRFEEFDRFLARGVGPGMPPQERRLLSFSLLAQLMILSFDERMIGRALGVNLRRPGFADRLARHMTEGVLARLRSAGGRPR